METYISEIEKICKNGCKKYGIKFDIPIEISNRMKTTYGYVEFKIDREKEKKYKPLKIVFAKFLFEEGNQSELINTILHELAHYIVLKQYPTKNHGHDKIWKKVAKDLGIKPNMYANSKDLGNPPKPKYVVKCCSCGATSNYYRKSKVIKNLSSYRCNCGGELELE